MRLHNLKLAILERRRDKDDMVQQYKVQAGIDEIHWSATPTTREKQEVDIEHNAEIQLLYQSSSEQMEQTNRLDSYCTINKQLQIHPCCITVKCVY